MAQKIVSTDPGNLDGEDRNDINANFTELYAKSGANTTATAAELNLLDDAPANVTIAYAASSTTDGIEATLTVVDAAGTAIDAIHTLNVWISDDTNGSGLTATAASGALTAATGTILTALTAKKHVIANTAATGILKLLLVDSANTAGERFCCTNPVTGKIVVGAATTAANYEGGS
jgi:hypothetical protein